ncbi:MAG: hypothetical protein AB1633_10735, partial [Elusimicrobiota bacterium]
MKKKQPEPLKDFLSNKVIFILLIAAVAAVYINTLGNQFVWDDEVIIVGNPYIKNWNYLKEVLTTGAFGEKTYAGSYLRPVQNLSFLIDYSIWKLNPLGYHLTNILLHSINSILIFLLLTRLKIQKKIGFFSALLFAIHPVNTEAVTYICGRGDMFVFLFEILGFLVILKLCYVVRGFSLAGVIYSVMSIVMLILAILSKENGVILPAIMLLCYFTCPQVNLFKDKSAKQNYLWTMIIMFLISAAYISTRLFALETSTTGTLSLIKNATFTERLLTVPKILLTYVRLFILPINLHMEYHFVEKSITSPSVWGSLLLLVGLFYFLYRFARDRRHAMFSLGWFLIGISPFTNVLVPIHTTVAERWFYVPLIGLITIAVDSIIRLYETKPYLRKFIISCSVLVGILFAFAAIRRNNDWSEPMKLYSHDLKYEPWSFLLHNNLGVEYFRKGMMAQAKQKFIDSIKASPRLGYDMAFNNLGVVYENEGNIEKAIENFKLAISGKKTAF